MIVMVRIFNLFISISPTNWERPGLIYGILASNIMKLLKSCIFSTNFKIGK